MLSFHKKTLCEVDWWSNILLRKTDLESTRKLFERDEFPLIDLDTEYVDGKRFYKTPEGLLYPSVTTVLSSQKNDAIDRWKARVGEAEAKKISKQATDRGTYLHSMCEDYLNNVEHYKRSRMPTTLSLFKAIQPIIDRDIESIHGIEMALYSDTLKAAGRCDLFCRFQGMYTILDFKTSTKEKKEEWIQNYFIQTTTYAIMIEEMYKEFRPIHIPQIAIVVAVEDDYSPQLFVKRTADYRDKVYELFETYHAQNPMLTLG